jgi:uncharacterized protein (TIGR00295 family)
VIEKQIMSAAEIKRAWGLLEETAREYKPEWKDSILEHAKIVHDAGLFLAGLFPGNNSIDRRIIALGAILHDIGRSRAQRVVEHGVRSGEIIREQGFPEQAARIGETHIGVGITRAEAGSLGLPDRDFVPATPEERIVCYVDNLLYYIPGEDRHELRDAEVVVDRFTRELGDTYGRRAREFMEGVEKEIGTEGFSRFREYVKELNKKLYGTGSGHSSS